MTDRTTTGKDLLETARGERSVNASQAQARAAPGHGSRDAALDGLRGIAIALVLWHHLFAAYLPAGRDSWLGWLRAGTNLAWCGVDLFFVLSGYFIGGILLDRRASPNLARVFYLRRAVRILPLYYVTLAVIFLLIAFGTPTSHHLFPGWSYALFLTNFALAGAAHWDWVPLSVLWSLAVEEQFYLAAPWVARALTPQRVPWALAGLALFAWGARGALLIFFPEGYFGAHVLTPLRMDGLALGALVAWGVRQPTARPFFHHLTTRWKWYLSIGLAAIAGVSALRPQEGAPILNLFGYSALSLSCAVLVAVVAGVRPLGLNRWLASPALAHLGRHSYFVYLWHAILGVFLIRWLGGEAFVLNSAVSLSIALLAVAVTWGAAALSWKYFESPLVAWGHRVPYEPARPPVTVHS